MNAMGDHSTASQESFKPFLELDVNLEVSNAHQYSLQPNAAER